ncbi:DUF2742 domain-containing protein [Mycolicibacterium sp.]|uniref:DUF2742 domain-containing protein n=1 Tax=Mycolicibacterium sp. TaxID=2320850 RepID=UPI0025D501DA|nr:DUF2742 domain-containing protein [Mycolicibacterium sp.]
MSAVDSRAVAWWPVHEFITAAVAQADNLPSAGTPAWCALADSDPRKLLAVAAAGEHHVLRIETAQQQRAEASKAIAAATDWAEVSRRCNRGTAYIPRRRGDYR